MSYSINSEEQLQAACYQWFWNTYPDQRQMLFHVQQSAVNRITGSRFKAIGVTKGVSDLVWVLKGAVVFIELKMPGGKQSDSQLEFEHKVVGRGHSYKVIYSLQEFQELVQRVL